MSNYKGRIALPNVKVIRSCFVCYKSFLVWPNVFKKPYAVAKYCSRKCMHEGSRSLKGRYGEQHHAWKGGKRTPRQYLMGRAPYREWRTSVFERDHYTCQDCGDKSGNGHTVVLNAHHIVPYHTDKSLSLDIENGQTLCVPCHQETDSFGGRAVSLKLNK